jgi:multiple sugar transport system ATP-binding protein
VFFCLLGPSGCGKSTTLRMIAGLEAISEGALEVDGVVMNDVPARDRDMAMVFQSYALYPHMSVYDNLAFGLRRRAFGKGEIDRRVREAAQMLGLGELMQRKPHALSGGQRQRVALGRAIVRDPRVFLFDEPLSNLDAALRASTRGEIIRLHQRLGTTMIYVTHDQVEAMTMSDRLCVMDAGRIVQVGRPLDVYRRPCNTFVARFLGVSPMNLFDAEVVHEGGACVARFAGGAIPLPVAVAPGKVTLGVRPEHVHLASEPGASKVAGRVRAIEPLGAETLLDLEVDDVCLTARVGGDCSMPVGGPATLFLRPGDLHMFDAATGASLGASA